MAGECAIPMRHKSSAPSRFIVNRLFVSQSLPLGRSGSLSRNVASDRFQDTPNIFGDDSRARRIGMNVVAHSRFWVGSDAFEYIGNERDLVFLGQAGIHCAQFGQETPASAGCTYSANDDARLRLARLYLVDNILEVGFERADVHDPGELDNEDVYVVDAGPGMTCNPGELARSRNRVTEVFASVDDVEFQTQLAEFLPEQCRIHVARVQGIID